VNLPLRDSSFGEPQGDLATLASWQRLHAILDQ
jgi:hypothetical protein